MGPRFPRNHRRDKSQSAGVSAGTRSRRDFWAVPRPGNDLVARFACVVVNWLCFAIVVTDVGFPCVQRASRIIGAATLGRSPRIRTSD